MISKSLKQIQQYDPFTVPPDIEIAHNHRYANLIGDEVEDRLDEICPCCYKPIVKKQFDLRCSIQDIKFLGEGITLYFKSIKMAIILLCILLVLFMIEWITYNHLICRYNCQTQEINILSSQLTRQKEYDLKFCLLGMIILVILTFLAKKYYDVETYLLQKDKYEPEQFAILFQGFPKCKQEDVKIWIHKQLGYHPIAVHIIYDIQEIKQTFQLKEKDLISLSKQNIKFMSSITWMSQSLDKQLLQKKQKTVNSQLQRLDSIILKFQHSKMYNQSGAIFVIFQNSHEVDQILTKHQLSIFQKIIRKIKKKPSQLKYCENFITLKRAMNPRDCIWGNFHYSHVVLKILATVLLIILGYLLLFVVAITHKYFFHILLWPYSFFATFFCYSIFHILMHLMIGLYQALCDWQSFSEKQKTSFYAYTYYNIFLVCMLPYTTQLAGANLLQLINLLLLLDAFIHPIIKIFNFSNIYRKIFASYIVSLDKKNNPYPQNYLNRLMEGRQFKLGQNYHYVIRCLLLSVYYSHAAPFALIYYIISLSCEYWTQKYLLLRKCRTPPKFSSVISNNFHELIGALPILYVLGVYNYTIHYYVNDDTYSWLFIILLLVAKLLSILLIVFSCSNQPQWKPEKTYSEAENDFTEYYQLENEIIKYNGQLKDIHKSFANRLNIGLNVPPKLDDTIGPLLDLEYKNSQVYSPQFKNTRARLIRRLLSTSIEMSRFAAMKDLQTSFET